MAPSSIFPQHLEPAHHPPVLPYTLQGVKGFWSRLRHPPDPGVRRVRSYQGRRKPLILISALDLSSNPRLSLVKPHFQVTLDDILTNKHLPPLSALDLELYLIYCETNHERGGVQNL